MLTSIQIENFRCFDKLKVDGLSRVNLIAGKNNVGKTSLLEAINLLAAGANPDAVVRNRFRRSLQVKLMNQTLANSLLFQPLFNQLNSSSPELKITGLTYDSQHNLEISYAQSKTLSLELPKNEYLTNIGQSIANNKDLLLDYSLYKLNLLNHSRPEDFPERNLKNRLFFQENNFVQSISAVEEIPIDCSVVSAHTSLSNYNQAELMGKIELQRKRESLVESLRILEPRLKDLTVIAMGGETVLHADLGYKRLLPFSVLGEGIYRLLTFLLAIINTPDGIVLIDEIENGIHHSALKRVWSLVDEISKQYKVQVIATTHSYECIQAASEIFLAKNGSNNFRLHRLDRIKDKFQAVTYDDEALEGAMHGYLEVR